MTRAEIVAVVVFDSILYNRTGTIGRWAERTERRFTLNAKKYAPMRSGELKAGIEGRINRGGPRQLITTITSHAPYSLFVIKGTTGPIMSRRRWASGGRFYMNVRAGNGFAAQRMLEVSGQRANNFFNQAAEATARTNRSLRGFHPGTIGF